MLYALPLSLFVGLLGTPRDEVLRQGPLALWVFLAMVVPFGIAIVLARYVAHHDLISSSLQALAVTGPGVRSSITAAFAARKTSQHYRRQ